MIKRIVTQNMSARQDSICDAIKKLVAEKRCEREMVTPEADLDDD